MAPNYITKHRSQNDSNTIWLKLQYPTIKFCEDSQSKNHQEPSELNFTMWSSRFSSLLQTIPSNTFFSMAPGTFCRVIALYATKQILSNAKAPSNILYFSNCRVTNPKTIRTRTHRNCTNTWTLRNTLLNEHSSLERQEGRLKTCNQMKMIAYFTRSSAVWQSRFYKET